MPLSRVPPLSPRLRPSAAQAVWPGSVSLVVSRGEYLQRMGLGDAIDLIGTPDSISLRVPNSTLTIALLKETGPLAITSANPSGACDSRPLTRAELRRGTREPLRTTRLEARRWSLSMRF